MNEAPVKRRRLLGAVRRVVARLASHLPLRDPPTSTSLPSKPSLRRARLHSLIGEVWLHAEQPERSRRSFERAFELGDPRAAVDVASSVMVGGQTRLVLRDHLGIVEGPSGDPSAAFDMFAAAWEADPQATTAFEGAVRALLADGQIQRAEQWLRNDGTDRPGLLAEVLDAKIHRDGKSVRSDRLELLAAYERHLAGHPDDIRKRDRLVRELLTAARFETARQVAEQLPVASSTRALIDWADLTTAGRFSDAHRQKLAVARSLATTNPSRSATVHDFVAHAQATNYANGYEAALDSVRRRWVFAPTTLERDVRRKIEADLQLLGGDPRPLRAVRQTRTPVNAAAEKTFATMVEGRHVVIIGPSPRHRPTGSELDAADVLVSTRFRHDLRRADQHSIVYLNDESLRRQTAGYVETLDNHPDQMLVVRPSLFHRHPPAIVQDRRVRIMQFEDSTPFLGTHFGIQRIVYDLLASNPSSITLSGVDFFVDQASYVDGYRAGDERGELPNEINFSHDHAYDFSYTRALLATGLLGATDSVRDILDTDTFGYLAQLEEGTSAPAES